MPQQNKADAPVREEDNGLGPDGKPKPWLAEIYQETGKRYGIPPQILIAQGFQESSFQRLARSPTGPLGPAQFTKKTARSYGLIVNKDVDERTDFVKSIDAQGRFMRDLLKKYGGNVRVALAGYNQGETVIDKGLKYGIPFPAEAQSYTRKIMRMAKWDPRRRVDVGELRYPDQPQRQIPVSQPTQGQPAQPTGQTLEGATAFPNGRRELRDLFTQLARPGATIGEVMRGREKPTDSTAPKVGYAAEQFKAYENIRGVRNNPNLTEGVYKKLDVITRKYGWSMETMLRIISLESAHTFNPSVQVGDKAHPKRPGVVLRAKKHEGKASGVIQFIPETARRFGTSPEALRQMSLEQQLEYVDRYLNQYARGYKKAVAAHGEVSLEEAYTSILRGRIETGDATLFVKGTKEYRRNDWVDINKDGRITAAESAELVRRETRAEPAPGESPIHRGRHRNR